MINILEKYKYLKEKGFIDIPNQNDEIIDEKAIVYDEDIENHLMAFEVVCSLLHPRIIGDELIISCGNFKASYELSHQDQIAKNNLMRVFPSWMNK